MRKKVRENQIRDIERIDKEWASRFEDNILNTDSLSFMENYHKLLDGS